MSYLHLPGPLILASGSPRRHELMKMAGLDFSVLNKDIDESFPDDLKRHEIASFLAVKKAAAYNTEIENGNIVLTADTIVCLENQVLNKAATATEAAEMLTGLSGKKHDVITAVCIRYKNDTYSFYSETSVFFKTLTHSEINHYIKNYKPFDKAGAYGIQEWIGLIGIEKIEGSYYNVMGLPVKEVFDCLQSLSTHR